MCIQDVVNTKTKTSNTNWKLFAYYLLAIVLAVVTALSEIAGLHILANTIADVFVNIFRCISLPIIATSIIVTIAQYKDESSMSKVWRRTLLYTLSTTLIAASVACILYLIISPASISNVGEVSEAVTQIGSANSYLTFIVKLIPTNFIAPFIEQQVMSVLLFGILIGIATRNIKNEQARTTINSFFSGLHEILLTITRWIVKVVPVAIYGFISVTVMQLKSGVEIGGLWSYMSIIVMANLIQGFVILPIWLLINGIKPFQTMRAMLPALSMAFFTKSSSGTLPVTIETAEKNINIDPKISRFVLPLCTTINMNGCAAFIFVTVIYLMQNSGVAIGPQTMLCWVLISTIAAVGNAGIPMGCFFLSASLLVSMNVPISILGLILPLYSLIDMLETALNVWSDVCITKVVDHKAKLVTQGAPELVIDKLNG